MFESATLPHELSKVEYKKLEIDLREQLLNAQFALVESKAFQVVVVVSGFDGAGKADCVRKLYEWLDPHHLETQAFGRPTEEERLRPRMWRYWRTLPAKGKISFVFGSWYHEPLHKRILGKTSQLEFERDLEAIARFESMLAAEGAIVLKLWLHLSRDQRTRRVNGLAAKRRTIGGEFEEWQDTGKNDFSRYVSAGEVMARVTSASYAPWFVIPSNDRRFRDIMVGKTMLDVINARLKSEHPRPKNDAPNILASLDGKTVLDGLNLSLKLDEGGYDKKLEEYCTRLEILTGRKKFEKRSVVAVFEGNDAAGKGGAIRRVSQALDPRTFKANAIGAPTDEEKAQPYLWRFWRRLPRLGHFSTFDRSWYGRVLVERIEGFCTEDEWLRAYNEINDFELQMSEFGIIVVKFWLAISKGEQLKRFKEREKSDYKRFKITDDDWRNRDKWDRYALAVGDMVDRTSTEYAPWTLVEAEDKYFARIKVLKTLCERIEKAL
jgi:polyphosphate:AMP phosphotransferase